MRTVLVTPRFKKDVCKIPQDIQEAADETIDLLSINPWHPGLNVKKLTNIVPVVYRVRIRHYRLIFSYTREAIILHRIRHRKDIYRDL